MSTCVSVMIEEGTTSHHHLQLFILLLVGDGIYGMTVLVIGKMINVFTSFFWNLIIVITNL